MGSRNLYILLIGIIFLTACDQQSNKATSNSPDSPSTVSLTDNGEEDLVAQIRLFRLDGAAISLEELAGKTIFLNFWATWCKPCLKEMPSIDRAREQLSGTDFVFLAASDEDPEKIKKFKGRHDYGFQLVYLKSNFPDLGIYSLPTTLIINGNGEIVMKKAGALEWDQPDMIKQLEKIAKNEQ